MKWKWTPRLMRWGLRLFPPYVGAGIKVTHIGNDWLAADVVMNLRWYNRNAVGTHFGGNLYSMVDPHVMLLLMNALGDDYIVWDKAAEIDFKYPGRGRVHCNVRVRPEELEDIREQTRDGNAYLPTFHLTIFDESKRIIAKVKKVLYVRRRTPEPGSDPSN